MDIKGLLSKKIKGVPVVAVAAVLAGAALYGAIRLKPTPEDVPEDDGLAGDPGDDGQPVFTAHKIITDDGEPVEDTNEVWARKAVEWLSANGTSLAVASSAISKYLDSQDLTSYEGAAVTKAVKQFGLPPEGISTSHFGGYNGPPTRQGNPPTKHTVKAQNDNTFKELALLYYGLTNWDAINLLHEYNPTVSEPFAKGVVIVVPKFTRPHWYNATSTTRDLYSIARKNGSTPAKIQALNPTLSFPVKVGTRVRVA